MPPDNTHPPAINRVSPASKAVDAFDPALARGLPDGKRLELYGQRWAAVQRAVAQAGARYSNAFFVSRGYWHTGVLRPGGWSWEHPHDLSEPIFIDGPGTVLVRGDCTADITITDDAVVHILGDLGAAITLQAGGEVVIAGQIRPGAALQAGGMLDLYTGGHTAGRIQAGGSTTAVIDGDLIGDFTAGQPVTTLHITGDCIGPVRAAQDAQALLTLHVEGFLSAVGLQTLLEAGFLRATADIGRSDLDSGLYPSLNHVDVWGTRSRWVIHQRADR